MIVHLLQGVNLQNRIQFILISFLWILYQLGSLSVLFFYRHLIIISRASYQRKYHFLKAFFFFLKKKKAVCFTIFSHFHILSK